MEESLREASCLGNVIAVENYIKSGVDVNAQNSVNGWTALHWAVKRGQKEIISLLLNSGANQDIKNSSGKTPFDIAPGENSSVGEKSFEKPKSDPVQSLPDFVPNYLKYPVFPYGSPTPPITKQVNGSVGNPSPEIVEEALIANIDLNESAFHFQPTRVGLVHESEYSPCGLCIVPEQIVLKARVKSLSQTDSSSDFVEVALDRRKAPTYDELVSTLREELELQPTDSIKHILKMPDTVVRSSNDVKRLTDYQMLEVVLI